jgi:hypothetical protein
MSILCPIYVWLEVVRDDADGVLSEGKFSDVTVCLFGETWHVRGWIYSSMSIHALIYSLDLL